MEAHAGPGAYKDLVLFLTTAAVVVPLFRRWKVSPILGFLGAGVLLGPHGLGALSGELPWLRHFTVDNPDEIEQLAEFGVVFLLFMIGLELSWERLRLMRRFVFGLGAAQVSLCPAVIAAAAMALGQPLPTAAAIGAASCASACCLTVALSSNWREMRLMRSMSRYAIRRLAAGSAV